jgi:hypothetical protein
MWEIALVSWRPLVKQWVWSMAGLELSRSPELPGTASTARALPFPNCARCTGTIGERKKRQGRSVHPTPRAGSPGSRCSRCSLLSS